MTKERQSPNSARRTATQRSGQSQSYVVMSEPERSPRPDPQRKDPQQRDPQQKVRRRRRRSTLRDIDWAMVRHKSFVSLKQRTFDLITDWRFFTLVGLALTGSLTALSIAFLFKLPAVPNCPAVFWPLASGSLRLHCAQIAAGKETVPDLLEGIKLLNTLSKDHPLYPEASRLIEEWSDQILELTEQDFQEGRIKQAIENVRKIPPHAAAAKQIEERVKRWETTWAKAEDIYKKSLEAAKKTQLLDARTYAAKLLSIDNTYWQTTKYQELGTLITATHKDMTKVGEALSALKGFNVDDLVAAIQKISEIGQDSFVYSEVKETLPKLGRKLLEIAQEALDRKDYNKALDIANRIPGNVNLGQEVDDFRVIASAQSKAWSGGVLNLEDAIADAQRIAKGRPLYDKAQRLIAAWQTQAQETARLDQAKQLAQAGDLQNAISQASQLSNSNQAAKDFIQQTTGQLQEGQDRPILNQAEQIALMGDEASLSSAIAQAKQIGSGRSLHKEAQDRIRQWSDQLKRLRNQTAEAQQQIARQSQPTAPSPTEAQPPASIDPTTEARQAEEGVLQQARDMAGSGTPDGLIQAIGTVQSIPDSSPYRNEAINSVDQWSQQLVQAAQYQSEFDVTNAIAIAQRVPPGTAAYAQAQELIVKWRKSFGQ